MTLADIPPAEPSGGLDCSAAVVLFVAALVIVGVQLYRRRTNRHKENV